MVKFGSVLATGQVAATDPHEEVARVIPEDATYRYGSLYWLAAVIAFVSVYLSHCDVSP
jgi:hypothetical protein